MEGVAGSRRRDGERVVDQGRSLEQATISFGSTCFNGTSYLIHAPGVVKLTPEPSPAGCASITKGFEKLEVSLGGSFPCKLSLK